jgi:hypothetical protein
MKALISPNEIAVSYDGTLLGQRVAQVGNNEFPIAPPLFWTDCPDDCVADLWYYSNGQCFPKPLPPESEPEKNTA